MTQKTKLPDYSPLFKPRWSGDVGGYTKEQLQAYGAACAAHAMQSQAERIKELEADRETALAPLQIALDEVSRLRAQLAEIEKREPVAWAISYDGVTPYTLWCEGDGALLDCEVKRQGGTTRKMPLFTRPMPAQPIIGLQAIHDAISVDPTLADCSQDVNAELVEALQCAKNSLVAFKLMPVPSNAWEDPDEANLEVVNAALSKYKGAK